MAEKTAIRSPDTLFSDDNLEVVFGLSEGPIKGLKNGAKSFFAGDTPLLDNAGNVNVGPFDLKIYKGINPAEAIKPNLGGTGSSTQVGVALTDWDQTLTRTGQHTNIDFIDVRIAINQLQYLDAKGNDLPAALAFQILVKPTSAPDWTSPLTPGLNGANSDTGDKTQIRNSSDVGEPVNSAYTEVYAQDTTPTGAGNGAIWFRTAVANGAPQIRSGGSWVTPTALTGTTVGAFYKWTFVDLEDTVRTAWWSSTGAVPDQTLGLLDFLVSPTNVTTGSGAPQSFVWNGSAFVDSATWLAPPATPAGQINVGGHITQTYAATYRIPVPRINGTYDVRVIRKSIKSDAFYKGEFSWESFQELNVDSRSYDDLAVAHLTMRSSDSFSTLPEFSGEYEGRIIRVPTNYNPVTRVYTGVWDGLFKLEYTDNIAWIAYDLVMNTRYGMNAYFPVVLDRWDTYEFAKHCDLHGFTMNEYITEPRNLKDMVDYVVGVAGGRFIDRMDGYSTILFDADNTPATAQFSAENVVDGIFSYSFTDVTERKNDFTVSFINPDFNWREDRIRVFDQTAIDVYGRNPETFVAVGCISEIEAVRRARYRLATALTETTTVTFKTNRQGLYLGIFDVVLVADPDMADGIGGRIVSKPNNSTLIIRDPIYLEAGITYSVSIQVPSTTTNKYSLITRQLAPASGAVTTLSLTTTLTNSLPDGCHFTITRADGTNTPKAYRVTGIDEIDGDPDNVSITALEVNRLKWAYVDGEVTLRELTGIVVGNTSGFVGSVSKLKILPRANKLGTQDLVLSWTASPTKEITTYRVYESVNGGPSINIGEPKDPTFTVYDVTAASLTYSVVAVGMSDQESPPVSVTHIISGGTAIPVVQPITNLAIADEPTAGTFTTLSPKFTWDASTSSFIQDYQVEVLNSAGTTVLRTIRTTDTTYTYEFGENVADGAGRSFILRVRARNIDGYLSNSVQLAANNPVPGAPNVTVTATPLHLFVSITPPSDKDVSGYVVHSSTTNGFTPGTGNLSYDGPETLVALPKAKGTWYVRVAAYDPFGKTGLTFAAQVTGAVKLVEGTNIEANTITRSLLANNIIDATALASSIQGIQVFGTVPIVYSGDYVTVGTPGVLYRWNGTAYIKAVSAGNLEGLITSSQIESIEAAKVAGQLTNAQIAALDAAKLTGNLDPARIASGTIDASKFVSGLEPVSIVSALPNPSGYSGPKVVFLNTDGKIYRYTGGAWVAAVAAVDVSGTLTNSQIASIDAAKLTGTLDAARIAAGALDLTKFASSIRPVEIVSALPSTGNSAGRMVFLTTNGKLYRYYGGAWVAAVASTDITGTIQAAQIAALEASKITGTLTDSQIASIDAAKLTGTLDASRIASGALDLTKFASSIRPVEIVSTLPSTGNSAGRTVFLTTDGKLYRYYGGSWVSAVAATDITGTVQAAQIAGLEASKITGTLTSSQIADLAAAKITGTIVASQIADATLTTAKFAAGLRPIEVVSTLPSSGNSAGRVVFLTTDSKLYRYNGSAWIASIASADITGTIDNAQIDGLAASKITGTLNDSQIAGLSAAKLTGTITDTQISDNAITTPKIFSGAITTAKIAAGAVTADEIAANAITAVKIQASAITTAKIATGAVTASEIATGAITTGKLDALAVTAEKIAANAIVAGKIQAGAVSAAEIAAGSITASKLFLTDLNNLLQNGDFAQTIDDDWRTTTPSASVSIIDAPGTTPPALKALSLAGSGTIVGVYSGGTGATNIPTFGFPIAIDEEIFVEVWAYSDATPVPSLRLGLAQCTPVLPTGTVTTTYTNITTGSSAIFPVTATWTRYTATFKSSIKGRGRVFIANDASANTLYVAAARALRRNGASLIVDGTISANHLAAGSVTTAKLVANAITANEIATDAVEAAKIKAGAITTAKIAAGAVTANEIAANTITAGKIAALTITANEIASNAITTGKIQAGAITATEIATDAITAGKVAAGAITTAKIATGAVTANEIAANTITANEIASNAITAGKIQAGAVSTAKIATGAVTANEIAANTITAGKIAALTITATEIASNAITTGKIQAGAVTATEIATDAITAGKVAAGAITTAKIATAAVTANEIAANTITASKIAVGTITATEIASNAITTTKIATGAVTANELAANSIIAGKIATGAVSADTIQAGAVTASKMVLVDTNLLLNPDFSQGITEDWLQAGTPTQVITSTSSYAGAPALNGALIERTTTGVNLTSGQGSISTTSGFAVTSGESFYAEAWFYGVSGSPSVQLHLVQTDTGGNTSVTSATQLVTVGVWTKLYATLTANVSGRGRLRIAAIANSSSFVVTQAKMWRRNAASLVVDGTITGSHIATNTISAGNIIAGTITATELAANAVTATKIAANAVLAASIAAGAVTAGKIAALAVSTNELAANAVTAAKIAANTITAAEIAAGAISATQLAAGAIVADKIGVGLNDNIIYNADLLLGYFGSSVSAAADGGVTTNTIVTTGSYVPAGMATASSSRSTVLANGTTYDLNLRRPISDGTWSLDFPAIAGEKYEASAYIACVGGINGRIRVQFRDASSTALATYEGNIIAAGGDLSALTDAQRSGIITNAAPTNTVSVRVTVRKTGLGTGTANTLYTTGFMLARALPQQTVLSRWVSSSGTVISGSGIMARTITADRISAGAITANEIASATITGNNIVAATITGSKIAADTITATNLIKTSALITATAQIGNAVIKTANIDDLQVTSIKFADGSVITKKIELNAITALYQNKVTSDTSNLAGTSGWYDVGSFNVTTASDATGGYLYLFAYLNAQVTLQASGFPDPGALNYRVLQDSTVVFSGSASAPSSATTQFALVTPAIYSTNLAAGTVTFKLQAQAVGGNGGTLVASWFVKAGSGIFGETRRR